MNRTIFCPKCERHLSVDQFCAAYVRPNTVRRTCKACQSKIARAWALAHPERAKETLVAYQTRRAEKQRATADYLASGTLHCRRCDRDLPVERFYKVYVYEKSKTGKCKECSSRDARAWKLANKERAAEWRVNSPKLKAWRSAWAKNNRATINEYMNGWYARNSDSVRARGNDRKAAIRGTVTPRWADKKAIRAFYLEARRLSKETGVPHHVDHIIPLKGKNVCGLHVENNLRVVRGVDNQRKYNKLDAEIVASAQAA